MCSSSVPCFLQDSQDPNPLIRALAVRTMGCIRVDKITEYLCDPLQRCLKDEVGLRSSWGALLSRQLATAMAVAKLPIAAIWVIGLLQVLPVAVLASA